MKNRYIFTIQLFLLLLSILIQNSQAFKINKQLDTLYIHLIPHSHDDVGWLKTVDEYYYGSNQQTQWAGVQYTIDTVLDELLKDKSRKFIQVETAFLYRWWIDSTPERQQQYRKLVDDGQIEFVNAGWCMHDEATPYYEDMIDQMTVGHQWILETFNKIPTVGWHIDPFGHSATNAALFSQMGFNGWWLGRVDYQDKAKRLSEKSMEMIWNPYQRSKEGNSIFTAVNYHDYNAPSGFNFDLTFRDEPIMDNKNLEYYNLETKCDQFVQYFRNMSQNYQSNHLLHTYGEDFNFGNALMQFKNIDKIMKYVNNNQDKYGVQIMYSTPSIYLEQIYKQNLTFPSKFDDFFPYADHENAYWTGYFTSRVAVKGYVRDTGRYLQHLRNILSLDKMFGKSQFLKDNYQLFQSTLDSLEQNMAILQHHDAVAGTEKQHVADDYQYRIFNSTQAINEGVLYPIMSEYAQKELNENVTFSSCNWNITDISQCQEQFSQFQNGVPLLLQIHNPTVARNVTIRIKVPNIPFYIIDQNNNNIYGELICPNIYSKNTCNLYFEDQQNSYSSNYYKLIPSKTSQNNVKVLQPKHPNFFKKQETVEISNNMKLELSNYNTQFKLITCQENKECQSNQFEVLYSYYPSYQGDGQKSGAYIFRPADDHLQYTEKYSEIKKKFIYNGKLVTVVTLYGTHSNSELRIYPNIQNVVELQTFLDSIHVEDNIGKEVVLQINTNINSNSTFYTDSNGLELQKRILNYRQTWDLQVNQPSSGNYYPVNGFIHLKDIDSGDTVSVLNDRSQGGTSLLDGQIELMLHRRTVCDDSRGVGEPLNETDRFYTTKGLMQVFRHYIVFEKENTDLARKVQSFVDSQSLILYAASQNELFQKQKANSNEQDPLNINQDPYLKVYFRPFGDYYLLRLNNMNENKITKYLIDEKIEIIEELTLTANQSKKSWKSKQYKWNTNDSHQQDISEDIEEFKNHGYINVKPLQLRAFKVMFKGNKKELQQQ